MKIIQRQRVDGTTPVRRPVECGVAAPECERRNRDSSSMFRRRKSIVPLPECQHPLTIFRNFLTSFCGVDFAWRGMCCAFVLQSH